MDAATGAIQGEQMRGQISIFDYIEDQDEHPDSLCSRCICYKCAHHYKDCPFGTCYDNKREKEKPYMSKHDKPVTLMSNWERYLDQWCKGGIFYPSHICERYERGTPTVINGVEFW